MMDQAEPDDVSRMGSSGKGASRPSSQPSQLAVVGGFSPNLSPMIIMNNVLLKQVNKFVCGCVWVCMGVFASLSEYQVSEM